MKKVGVWGSYVVDVMARAPYFPNKGETVKGSYSKLSPGGKGFNQAIAAKKAGADLLFSTKVGKDSFAQMAFDSLNENKIDKDNIVVSDTHDTGIALILVNEKSKENEIIVVPGACETYLKKEIDEIFDNFGDIEYLLLQLEINNDANSYIVEKAKERGIKIILNPSPYSDCCKSFLNGLFLVTPNETEASLVSNLKCEDIEDYRKISDYFFENNVENVIITLGSKGLYYNDRKTEKLIDNFDVEVVDTTGAGDAFNGGLLAGLSFELDLLEATKYGNIVSNLSVRKMGTSISMPKKSEIMFFMSTIIPK